MLKYRNVAIIGVGLIGGSIGLALRKRGLTQVVTGIGRNRASLDRALAVGAVDSVTTDLAAGLAHADAVIVATPVDSIVEHVCQANLVAPKAQFITDAGSTKARICSVVDERLAGSHRFVGSHPLAGDHRTGPEFSRADLLEDRTVVVTPTGNTATELLELVADFWQALGSMVHVMSPMEHDQALAATSHLPHLIASVLAKSTPQEYLPLSATGWADTTRVAAGDPELWTQIFSQNAESLLSGLDTLMTDLADTRQQLASGDWTQIKEFLQEAKRIRDALGN